MPMGPAQRGAMLLVQRCECKYALTEAQAIAVRQYLRPFLTPDDHTRPDGRYQVYNLYFDDARWSTYWWSVFGQKDRFKLRLRHYGSETGNTVFLEVKHRLDRIIYKRRAILEWDEALRLLADPLAGDPEPSLRDVAEHANAAAFRHRLVQLQAAPTVGVAYEREAWQDLHLPHVRVTFDRALRVANVRDAETMRAGTVSWEDLRGPEVILEIKFTNSYPAWVQRCVQHFELQRTSFAKYVVAANHLRGDELAPYEVLDAR